MEQIEESGLVLHFRSRASYTDSLKTHSLRIGDVRKPGKRYGGQSEED